MRYGGGSQYARYHHQFQTVRPEVRFYPTQVAPFPRQGYNVNFSPYGLNTPYRFI